MDFPEKVDTDKVDFMSSGESDEKEITNLGYVEELRREFSIWSLGSLCLCLMATWEALSSVVAAALTSGGAPCLFYNYIISFIGSVAIAASLAEIASIYPTAGGQYHWVAVLAPKNQKILASWFTGWISCGGQIVLTASAAFNGGLQLQAFITLHNPDSYTPQRWQGMLFYWAILIYAAIVNIWGVRILPQTNLAAGVLHIAGFIAIVVVLGVMAPKHDAHYVFVEVTNNSGWTNNGVSWLVGLLSTVYPFLGYDSACHLSEEMPQPSRNVPIAMVGSVVVNGIIGFVYALVLLFSLGSLDDLLASPTGFPFLQLFKNVTNDYTGAIMLALSVAVIAVAANVAGVTSTSRTVWAFARDNAMPYSSVFQMLLGFIYLGNTTAFNAIMSMAILGMYASYILPILYMIVYGRKKLRREEYGPFYLGNLGGKIINCVAIGWLILAMVFSTFPSYMPVTPQNMNYCVVVMGGWLVFGVAFFFFSARKKYSGPIVLNSDE